MKQRTTLIVTSISPPNTVLTALAHGCTEHGIDFIVIGDVTSPPDYHLEGCDFWNIERQATLKGALARLMPLRHYARKNLGYLLALQRSADIIIETDDDNLPMEPFWEERHRSHHALTYADTGWLNVYRHFSEQPVWPRGFPLEHLQNAVHKTLTEPGDDLWCPIQQGLADDNPDVDAIYRLTRPLPVCFSAAPPIALGSRTWSPFNSQNTTWFREAFPLLYLPYYCSFRMTDIWRSFVAQRICWENSWHILYHAPTVRQVRNEHDLLRDFSDEIPGYLHNARIAAALEQLELQPGTEQIPENMRCCYRTLIAMNLVGEQELVLLDAWLHDIAHYSNA